MVLIQLGEAQLAINPEQAERNVTRALVFAQQHGERGNEAWAVYLLGEVAAQHPPLREEAATHATRAMALATELGMRPLIAHCHLSLGVLSRRAGQPEPARMHLSAANAMYREMDMPFWWERAQVELAGQRGGASENAPSSV